MVALLSTSQQSPKPLPNAFYLTLNLEPAVVTQLSLQPKQLAVAFFDGLGLYIEGSTQVLGFMPSSSLTIRITNVPGNAFQFQPYIVGDPAYKSYLFYSTANASTILSLLPSSLTALLPGTPSTTPTVFGTASVSTFTVAAVSALSTTSAMTYLFVLSPALVSGNDPAPQAPSP